MDETIYLSKLKIIRPQRMPNPMEAQISSKIVYMAYAADNVAKTAVKKTIPPIPANLFHSLGVFRKI